jgi:signal transduction histidine kinase
VALRWKLLLPLNLVLLFVWLGHDCWHLSTTRKDYMEFELKALRHLGLGLRFSVEQAQRSGRPVSTLQSHLETLGRQHRDLEIMILDRRSVVLASSIPKRIGRIWREPDIDAVLSGRKKVVWKHEGHSHDGVPSADASLAVTDDAGRPLYAIHVAKSLAALEQGIWRHRLSSLVFVLLLFCIAGIVLNVLFHRFVIRPMGLLQRQMESSGWSPSKEQAPKGDEIVRLRHAFQGMMQEIERATDELKTSIDDKSRLLQEVTVLRDRLAEKVEQTRHQLHETEAALVRSERFAALGQLSGALAHEIRNPLHIVRGTAETAARRVPEAAPFIEDIKEEVDRIAKLIDRLLDYTRPVECHPERIDCVTLLADVQDKVKRIRDSSKCNALRWERRSTVPAGLLEADPLLISQALVNLVDNACVASPEDGLIRLSADLGEGEEVVFRVMDEGVGVEPELVDRVFEPFVTGREAGTGLGLAIVQKIADILGGDVRLDVRQKGGTCATLTIPFRRASGAHESLDIPAEREENADS